MCKTASYKAGNQNRAGETAFLFILSDTLELSDLEQLCSITFYKYKIFEVQFKKKKIEKGIKIPFIIYRQVFMCSVPFKNAIAILSCNEQGSNNNYSVIKLSITHGTWSCISSHASKRRPFFKCQKWQLTLLLCHKCGGVIWIIGQSKNFFLHWYSVGFSDSMNYNTISLYRTTKTDISMRVVRGEVG